ncbi:MAG: hypothetical protein KA354_06595 [Phycisphaerae bacterium]|nr:hypothetical protein [Phycisphaerae bacterium]
MKLSHLQRSSRRRLMAFGTAILLVVGAVGCNDPDVQTAVVNGLSDFAQAMIAAWFTTLLPNTSSTVTTSLMSAISGGFC